jgi:hypothetical protein
VTSVKVSDSRGTLVTYGPYHPAKSGGNVARKRNRLALHVSSPVFFLKSPIGIHAPQEAAVVALRI